LGLSLSDLVNQGSACVIATPVPKRKTLKITVSAESEDSVVATNSPEFESETPKVDPFLSRVRFRLGGTSPAQASDESLEAGLLQRRSNDSLKRRSENLAGRGRNPS
jgi:hypothetical protein